MDAGKDGTASPPREAFTGRLRQRAALAGSETDWNSNGA